MRRAVLLALVVLPSLAHGDAGAYRLRADALVQARAPAGVLILDGEGEVTPELGVEVYLWGGLVEDVDAEADLLVAALSYVDAAGRGEVRAGRLLVTSGALRPVHMDGLSARARLPSRTSLQLFAGLPAVPRLGERTWDWAAGGRLAQDLGDATVGVAYLQQRDAGQLAFHELGFDVALFPAPWIDVGARSAVDLISPGLAELVATVAVTLGPVRATLSGTHRSPAHRLPATSLFTVLGDRAQQSGDARLDWQAAPRLLLSGGGGLRLFDDRADEGAARTAYEDLFARAELRLSSDPAAGTVGVELHRQGAPRGGWWGLRAYGRAPLAEGWALSGEVELVGADAREDRGALWPWALVALSWWPWPGWELAVAGETSGSPEVRHAVDLLLRVGYQWRADR